MSCLLPNKLRVIEQVKEAKGFVDELSQKLAYCEAKRANLSQHFEESVLA